MRLARWTTRAVTAAALCLLAYAIARHFAPPDMSRAFPTGEIRIGIDAGNPPFAWDDGETLRGLEVDLAQALASEIGLPARLRSYDFYSAYDALLSGEVDALVASLTVDPARMDRVRYSQPYFDNGLALVASGDSPGLDADGLTTERLAVEYAGAGDGQLRRWLVTNPRLRRMPYELPNHALDAVRLGHADAALVDNLTYRLYMRDRGDWSAAAQFVTHDEYVIAVRRDNRDAWRLLDGALAQLQANGEVARLVAEWV